LRIDNLTIRLVPSLLVPDVSKYIAAVEKVPEAKRSGVVETLDLESAVPGKPVRIDFYKPTEEP